MTNLLKFRDVFGGDRPGSSPSASPRTSHFSKTPALSIRLVAGLGVEGDGHFGEKQHRLRAMKKSRPAEPARSIHPRRIPR